MVQIPTPSSSLWLAGSCPSRSSNQRLGWLHHEWNADAALRKFESFYALSLILTCIQQWQDYFGHPTGNQLGIFNGTQGLGGAFAALWLWWVVERIGRKYTIVSLALQQSTTVNLGG